jgi:hypothetical protein
MNRNNYNSLCFLLIFIIPLLINCKSTNDCDEYTIKSFKNECEFCEQEFPNAKKYVITNSSKIIEFCLGIRNDTLFILKETFLSDTADLKAEPLSIKEFYLAYIFKPFTQIPLLDINMRGENYIHYFDHLAPRTGMSSTLFEYYREPNDTVYSIVQELFYTNLTLGQDVKRKYRFIKYSKSNGIIEFYEFGTCDNSLFWFY